MATGTGKTFTAFQIIHKLHKTKFCKKILYLADRNILIDQTMQNDFKPFQKVMTKIEHRNMDSSFEIYMSLYHQMKSQVKDIYKRKYSYADALQIVLEIPEHGIRLCTQRIGI